MSVQILAALNILSAPFGFIAMYYGYKGYIATRGGLKVYQYFFIATTSVGAILLFNLVFRIMGIFPEMAFLVELAFLMASIFYMLAFKDMYEFLSSVF